MDMDLDVDRPAVVAPDVRRGTAPGGSPGEWHALELPAPAAPDVEIVRVGDDQVYAAAELVRRGLARRVVLLNALIDPDLPEEWDVRGTPVHLERLDRRRSVLVAGPSPAASPGPTAHRR